MANENKEEFVVEFKAEFGDTLSALDKLSETLDSFGELPGRLQETKANVTEIVNQLHSIESANATTIMPDQFVQGIRRLRDAVDSYADVSNKKLKALSPESLAILKNRAENPNGAVSLEESKTFTQVNKSVGLMSAVIKDLQQMFSSVGSIQNAVKTSVARQGLNNELIDIRRSMAKFGRAENVGLMSDKGFVRAYMENPVFKKAQESLLQKYPEITEKMYESMLMGMVPTALASFKRTDFNRAAQRASAGIMKQRTMVDRNMNYQDRLPERFRDVVANPANHMTIPNNLKQVAEERISKQELKIVSQTAKQNEEFRRALINAGVGSYGRHISKDGRREAGVFSINPRMTRKDLAAAEGQLIVNSIIPGFEGDPFYYKKLTDPSAQRSFVSKTNKMLMEGLAAVRNLEFVNAQLPPIIPSAANYKVLANTRAHTKRVGTIGEVRPSSYTVMSLTPEDFVAGKVPANYETATEDRNGLDFSRGQTQFKAVSQSAFTDLIGMHGHRTMGKGVHGNIADHPEMLKAPQMIVIDYGGKMLKKDKNGMAVYENGDIAYDEKAISEVEKLFTPNKTLDYTLNRTGEKRQYKYPVIVRHEGDKDINYVPTNAKGGNIIVVREDIFKNTSTPYLEEFGRNVFDNFADPERIYGSESKGNKVLEARNRLLTPSLPFESVGVLTEDNSLVFTQSTGGVNPKSKQVAFVNVGQLTADESSEEYHDGSMFFMPGFVPGKNSTLRLPGLKGVGQEFDYKSYIRDLYGLREGDPFYLPAINATEDIKKRLKEHGLSQFSKEELDKYFIDIMKYDALVTDSVLKTPLFSESELFKDADGNAMLPNNQEAQDILSRLMSLTGGFRSVQTSAGFLSKNGNPLSRQTVQGLVMTPEDVERNRRIWDDHINALLTRPDYLAARVFTNKDDPFDTSILNDPTKMWTENEARLRALKYIESQYMAKTQGKLFVKHGDKEMALAVANPAEIIMKYGALNGLTPADEELASISALSDDTVAGGKDIADGRLSHVGGNRFPQNQGEYFNLKLNHEYMNRMRKYGIADNVLYMNKVAIDRMGGGDFDGDTVQLVFNDIQKMFEQTQRIRGQEILKYQDKDLYSDTQEALATTPTKITPGSIASLLARQVGASVKMGSVSTAMEALSQGNWNDEIWLKTVGGRASVSLRQLYDILSTYQKTGANPKWDSSALQAKNMRAPFFKLFRDLESSIENNDNEKLMKITGVNFPSIYDPSMAIMFNSLKENPISPKIIDQYMRRQRELYNIPEIITESDFKNKPNEQAEFFKAKFYDKNIRVITDMLSNGAFSGVSQNDEDEMNELLMSWSGAIGEEEVNIGKWKQNAFNQIKQLKEEGKDDTEEFKSLTVQMAAYNKRSSELQSIRKTINWENDRLKRLSQIGITEQAVRDGLGWAEYGFFGKEGEYRFTGTPVSAFGKSLSESSDEALKQANLRRIQFLASLAANEQANGALVALTQKGMSENDIIAARQNGGARQADSLRYSYSMLRAFEVDPMSWFSRFVSKERYTPTHEAQIGTSIHKALEEMANYRKDTYKGGAIPAEDPKSNPDYWAEIFEKELLKSSMFKKDEHGDIIPVFADVSNEKYSNKVNQLKNRISKAFNFARSLPSLLSDETIIGAEMEATDLPFGNKITDPNSPLNNSGKLDLKTSTKDGKVIIYDLKASTEGHDPGQQILYSMAGIGKDATHYGFIPYLGGNTVVEPITDEAKASVLKQNQETIKRIQIISQMTGLNPDIFRQYIAPTVFGFDQILPAHKSALANLNLSHPFTFMNDPLREKYKIVSTPEADEKKRKRSERRIR